jgi:hypothetical protein
MSLARALEAEPSANYFDMVPGEPVDIRIRGTASVDDVRRNLAVRSLADAFGPDPRDPADASRDHP